MESIALIDWNYIDPARQQRVLDKWGRHAPASDFDLKESGFIHFLFDSIFNFLSWDSSFLIFANR